MNVLHRGHEGEAGRDFPTGERLELVRRQWHQFVQQMRTLGGAQEAVPSLIFDSWQRSRDAGVDPERPRFHRVPEADLRARLERNRLLLAAAVPEIKALSKSLRPLRHWLYLADHEGIVLFSVPMNRQARDAGLAPGHDWSELRMGTNGAGTALATGRPVAVLGCEHYCRAFHGFGCLAAPILVDGRCVAALDLALPVEEVLPAQLGAVARVAYRIERLLAGGSGS